MLHTWGSTSHILGFIQVEDIQIKAVCSTQKLEQAKCQNTHWKQYIRLKISQDTEKDMFCLLSSQNQASLTAKPSGLCWQPSLVDCYNKNQITQMWTIVWFVYLVKACSGWAWKRTDKTELLEARNFKIQKWLHSSTNSQFLFVKHWRWTKLTSSFCIR